METRLLKTGTADADIGLTGLVYPTVGLKGGSYKVANDQWSIVNSPYRSSQSAKSSNSQPGLQSVKEV
jgi:hypothetical protein